MNEHQSAVPVKPFDSWLRRARGYGIALCIGLAVGLVPAALRLSQMTADRANLRERLEASELENHLGRAALLARHDDYPAARDAASEFYSAARARLDDPAADVTAARRSTLLTLLGDRDAVITLLARSDPAAAERLSAIYLTLTASSVP